MSYILSTVALGGGRFQPTQLRLSHRLQARSFADMSPLQELRFLILAAQRTGSRMLTGVLKPLGLTPAQIEVLQVLHEFGSITLKDLGGLLICESGSPSRLVAGLVDRGLIARSSVEGDGRAIGLALTATGAALLAKAAAIEPELAKLIGGVLSAEEIAAMNAGLRKLVAGSPAGQAVERRKHKPD